jgi:hypothetical protein
MNLKSWRRASWILAVPCAVSACGARLDKLGDAPDASGPGEDASVDAYVTPVDASVDGPDQTSADAGPPPVCHTPAPSTACAGNASLTATGEGAQLQFGGAVDGGPPVGLVSASDAGTTIMIAMGAHPLDGACLALSAEGCGRCSWLSITLPQGTGPGTYAIGDGDGGVATSLEGFTGTLSLTQVGSTVAGSFSLSEPDECGLPCEGSVGGTFSIPSTCDESVCAVLDAGGPSGCPGPLATYVLPGAPGGDFGEPGNAVFFTYGPDGGSLGLAVADIQNTLLDVYLSEGDGGFGPATQLVLDPNYPLTGDVGLSGGIDGVASADLNGDHVSDLVISTYLPSPYFPGVGILLGQGDGTFSPPVYYPINGDAGRADPSVPVVADLNGDGHVDVVVADYDVNLVSVLYGVGDGTLEPVLNISLPNTNAVEPGTIATGDFDRDGKTDLVVGSIGRGSQLFLIPGQGAAGFGTPVAFGPPEPNWNDNPQAIAAAELRPGSGIFDLVVAHDGEGGPGLPSPGSGLDVFLGNGDGTFQAPVTYSDPCRYDQVGSVNIADVNRDGIPDLVGTFDSTETYATELGVWLGKGDGTFVESERPISINAQGGFAGVTTIAMQPNPAGTLLLVTQPYFFSAMVEPVSNSCF